MRLRFHVPVAAALLLASIAPGQTTPIPGSGCRVSYGAVCTFAGTPGLGHQVGFTCGCATPWGLGFVMIGVELPTMLPLSPPTVCATTRCYVACLPVVALSGTGVVPISFTIPVQPGLVGQCICVQSGCLPGGPGSCLDVAPALRMCIQP